MAAAPTSIAGGLDLLYYYVAPMTDHTVILGELQNTSQQERVSPYLRFTLFDADPRFFHAVSGIDWVGSLLTRDAARADCTYVSRMSWRGVSALIRNRHPCGSSKHRASAASTSGTAIGYG